MVSPSHQSPLLAAGAAPAAPEAPDLLLGTPSESPPSCGAGCVTPPPPPLCVVSLKPTLHLVFSTYSKYGKAFRASLGKDSCMSSTSQDVNFGIRRSQLPSHAHDSQAFCCSDLFGSTGFKGKRKDSKFYSVTTIF